MDGTYPSRALGNTGADLCPSGEALRREAVMDSRTAYARTLDDMAELVAFFEDEPMDGLVSAELGNRAWEQEADDRLAALRAAKAAYLGTLLQRRGRAA